MGVAMKATDLVDKLNVLIQQEGDFEILTTSPEDEVEEYCEATSVSVKNCFYYEGFRGKQFMETGIGTSKRRRERAEKYVVIE